MTFDKLRIHVDNVNEMLFFSSVHFGCDCGCGGDFMTKDQWDKIFYKGEASEEALKKLGVIFNE